MFKESGMTQKWYTLSVDETEALLKTNCVSGLDRKAVRAGRARVGNNSFFILPRTDVPYYLKEVLTQPVIILLAVLGILFLIFDENRGLGVAILALTGFYACFLFFGSLFAAGVKKRGAVASRPVVRVIRDGRLIWLDCLKLVPGDIVELEGGDVAPCDLKLVQAAGLRVSTYLGRIDGRDCYVPSVKEDGGVVCTPEEENDISRHSGMLYGGSRIEAGRARAIVVETGKHTYIGALQGGVSLVNGNISFPVAEKVRRVSNRIRLGLWISILPLCLVCIWLPTLTLGVPALFAVLLCLIGANLFSDMESVIHISIGIGLYLAEMSGKSPEKALIKTERGLAEAADVDYVFLLGRQAFSDGKLHLAGSFLPGVDPASPDAAQIRREMFSDAATLLMSSQTAVAAGGEKADDSLYQCFFACAGQGTKTEFSEKPVMKNYRAIVPGPAADALAAEGEIGGRSVAMALTFGKNTLSSFSLMRTADGYTRISGESMKELWRFSREKEADGKKIVTLSYRERTGWVLAGVFALSEDFVHGRREAVKALCRRGIQPVLFLNDGDEAAVSFVKKSGILASDASDPDALIARAGDFASAGWSITEGWGQFCAYLGFSSEEIASLMNVQISAGKKIAVLTDEPDKYALFRRGQVKFTCAGDVFSFKPEKQTASPGYVGGTPREIGVQQMIGRADVLIPRAEKESGGICSILHTVRTVGQIERNLLDAFFYLLSAQLFRMMLIFPLFVMGIEVDWTIPILLSSFLVDPLAVVLLNLRRYPYKAEEPIRIEKAGYLAEIFSQALFSAVLLMATLAFMAQGKPDPGSAHSAIVLALYATQLTVFFRRFRLSEMLPQKANIKLFFGIMACTLVSAVLLCILCLGSAFGLSPIYAPYGYLIPIGPVAIVVVYFVVKLYMLGRFWES